MAERPVFITASEKPYYVSRGIEFTYCPGFSLSQKQKSVNNMHTAFLEKYPKEAVLEISSKSTVELGQKLSAFNLKITLTGGTRVSVESAFQAGKIFENGKQYKELLKMPPYVAKKDERLRSSGAITGFEFEGQNFPTEPKTLFYNWLYIKALTENRDLAGRLLEYTAFTDIEFNPKKSINCQAIACAVYVSLEKNALTESALKNPQAFMETVYSKRTNYTQMKMDI